LRKKLKYFFGFILGSFFLIYSIASAYGAEVYNVNGKNVYYNYPPITIVINGEKQSPPMKPLMFDDRVFVPVRFVSEKMGAKVDYDKTKVTITYMGDKITLYFYKDTAYINDKVVKLDSSVKLINYGYTYVPLRFIGEALNNDVNWDGKTKTVYIISKEQKISMDVVVNGDRVNVRTGPDTKYDVITTVSKGEVLKALAKLGDWYKVQLKDNKAGWIAGWLVIPKDQVQQSSQNPPKEENSPNTTSSQQKDASLPKYYTVEDIKFNKQGDLKQVVISTNSSAYKVTKDSAKSAILVNLDNTVLKKSFPAMALDDDVVRGIIPSQVSSTAVQIAITLNKDANYDLVTQNGKLIINIIPSVQNVQNPLSPADTPKLSLPPLMVSGSVVNIRTGPGTQYDIITQVNRGEILEALNKSGDWYNVRLKDGTVGWISALYVTVYDKAEKKDYVAGVDRRTGTTPSRGDIGQALSTLPYAGKGVWYSIYTTPPTASDISLFAASNITHIYLEVATSISGFPDKWKAWLDSVLPAARRAGIKVIAWLYTDLKNPSYDADLTVQVATYVTPSGHTVDAVAADIEELPQKDPVKAAQIVEDYAKKVRSKLPSNVSFIAITFPPQYRPSYPYATMAKYFDAIALMDYWNISNRTYTYDDAKSFVMDSVNIVRTLAGDDVHIEVILQGYAEKGLSLPTLEELRGGIDGAREANAIGYSVYKWNTLTDEHKNLFANY